MARTLQLLHATVCIPRSLSLGGFVPYLEKSGLLAAQVLFVWCLGHGLAAGSGVPQASTVGKFALAIYY